MSIKNLIHRDKRKNCAPDVSKETDLSDQELRELRELARETSWAYSVFPPTGFPGTFWYFH